MSGQVRPLGWGRFLLQLLSVAIAYFAGSIPGVLIWGIDSTGLAMATAGSSAFGILAAWLWLRRDGALAQAFALQRPDSWPKSLTAAILAALAIQAWFQIGGALLRSLGLPPVDTGLVMDAVTSGPGALALWIIAVAWFAAGFGEELLWRGFLLDRLLRLKGIAGRTWLAIAIQAVLFGLPHAYQGPSGLVVTGVVGILFGWLRTRTAWNLWPLIIGHGLVNTISMLLGYASKHGMLPF